MNSGASKNLPASVHQRLLNIARQRNLPLQRIIHQYAVERLLYRLSRSPHRGEFILKGAMLFLLWKDTLHRLTRDLDLLSRGEVGRTYLTEIFRDLCRMPVEEDGLQFLPDSVSYQEIREEEIYGGVRIKLLTMLGKARISLQVDVGFGDAVTPAVHEADFPTLLPFPIPRLWVYPREVVVAEKYQTMIVRGLFNSRMKDFYDIWILAHEFSFSGEILCQAIAATFDRRRTSLPHETPITLIATFGEDKEKWAQWQGFLSKNEPDATPLQLPEVTAFLHSFLMPPTQALIKARSFDATWPAGGPWQAHSRK